MKLYKLLPSSLLLLILLAGMLPASIVASGEGPTPEEDDPSSDGSLSMPNEDSADLPSDTDPVIPNDTDSPVLETDPPTSETEIPTTISPTVGGIVAELLDKVVSAVGGADALINMRYLQVMSRGETKIDFEGTTPTDLVNVATYKRNYTIDLFDGNVRVDEYTNHLFENFQFFPPSVTTRIMQRQIGEQFGTKVFTPDGTMLPTAVASLSRQLAFQNPHILLIYILSNDLAGNVTYGGTDANGNSVLVVPDPDDIWPISMTIDEKSGFVNKITFKESHPLVGDRLVIFRYINWVIKTEGDSPLLFPRRLRISTDNDKVVWDERRDSVMTPSTVEKALFEFSEDMDTDSFDEFSFIYGLANSLMFETFDMTGFIFRWMNSYGNITELAKGVTLMASTGGYNNLVLEHPDGLIMLEGFGSQFQSNEFLSVIMEKFPGQNITHLLQTHHHFDHSSGVRQIMGGEDVILVVGDGVQDFWEEVLTADNSIIPDSIQESGKSDFNIESLSTDEVRVLLETDDMVVTAYATSLAVHAADMLIFTIDADGQRFVFEGDLYNAGAGFTVVVDGPAMFFDIMRSHGIINDDCTSDLPLTIVPVHGVTLTLEEALAELASLDTSVGCP